MNKIHNTYTESEWQKLKRIELGNMLRKMRCDSGMSLNEVSQRLSIAKSTLQNWEIGRSCPKKYCIVHNMIYVYWGEIIRKFDVLSQYVKQPSQRVSLYQSEDNSFWDMLWNIELGFIDIYKECGRNVPQNEIDEYEIVLYKKKNSLN